MSYILARLAGTLPSLEIPRTSKKAPESIQWMPPGTHTVNATSDGEPATLTITVDESVAIRMNEVLQELRAKAADGSEDLPFFDFNHDDDAASGNPTEFYWAGEDPKKGGVRAKVEWTMQGEEALLGRAYRRFSPGFYMADSGEITGAPINMGGLVNRAAFKNIAPVLSKAGPQTNPTNNMAVKIDTSATPTDLSQALAIIAALRIQATETEQAKAVTAKDTEITNLKATNADLQKQLDKLKLDAAEANAKVVVAKAVGEGKLPPQAKEIHTKWIERIAKDPTAVELLDAMPANPALGTVVNAGAGDANAATAAAAGAKPGEHQFLVKAKALSVQNKINLAAAQAQVASAEPALYTDYCKSL